MTITTTCPRQKSDMTPCYLKDEEMAVSDDGRCVGCDRSVKTIVEVLPMTVSADAQSTGEILAEMSAKAHKE